MDKDNELEGEDRRAFRDLPDRHGSESRPKNSNRQVSIYCAISVSVVVRHQP